MSLGPIEQSKKYSEKIVDPNDLLGESKSVDLRNATFPEGLGEDSALENYFEKKSESLGDFTRRIRVGVSRLFGRSIENEVWNPFGFSVNDEVKIKGISEKIGVLKVVSVAEVRKDHDGFDDSVRTSRVHLSANKSDGSERSFMLKSSADELQSDSKVTLLEKISDQENSPEIVAKLNSETVDLDASEWKRIGLDKDGIDGSVFEIYDPNGDGVVTADECKQGREKIWSYYAGSGSGRELLTVISKAPGTPLEFWRGQKISLSSISKE